MGPKKGYFFFLACQLPALMERTKHCLSLPQNYAASTPPKPSSAPPHTTLQRSVRAAGPSRVIPRFHFPKGRPPPAHQQDHALHKVQSAFATFPNSQVCIALPSVIE